MRVMRINYPKGALKKAFSPEFLNRLDDVIVYQSFGKRDNYT